MFSCYSFRHYKYLHWVFDVDFLLQVQTPQCAIAQNIIDAVFKTADHSKAVVLILFVLYITLWPLAAEIFFPLCLMPCSCILSSCNPLT